MVYTSNDKTMIMISCRLIIIISCRLIIIISCMFVNAPSGMFYFTVHNDLCAGCVGAGEFKGGSWQIWSIAVAMHFQRKRPY